MFLRDKHSLPLASTLTLALVAFGGCSDDEPADSMGSETGSETVDASGLHLIPGVVDDQVHFREPGLTHKEDLHTASRALM